MNRQPDTQGRGTKPALAEPQGEDDAQALMGDYLDHLCAPLLGIVPYAQRRRLRAEAEDHLLALSEDAEAEGFAPAQAVAAALREYGEPWRIGQDWAEAWLCGKAPSRLSRLADIGTLRAFGWFGVFTVLNLLLIEWHLLVPFQPDLYPLVQCLWVAAPVAAGALTGAAMHPRAGVGICHAVAILSLASAAVGLLLRPASDGLLFALFQIAFWIPVGRLSATVTASLRRQLRLQGFRPTTWQMPCPSERRHQ